MEGTKIEHCWHLAVVFIEYLFGSGLLSGRQIRSLSEKGPDKQNRVIVII